MRPQNSELRHCFCGFFRLYLDKIGKMCKMFTCTSFITNLLHIIINILKLVTDCKKERKYL